MDFLAMSKAPQDLIDLWYKESLLFYKFLPSNSRNIQWCYSGLGYMLKTSAPHSSYIMFLGDADITSTLKDVTNGIVLIRGEDNNPQSKFHFRDYKIDWDERRLRKYKSKNSTERRIKEENITINVFNDDRRLPKNEIIRLQELWKDNTKSQSKVELKYDSFYGCDNVVYICYYANGILGGFQVFENVGDDIYFQINILDYKLLGKSCVCWTYPIEYFNKEIHYLGSRVSDYRLNEHKMRMCDGKFYTFDTFMIHKRMKDKESTIKTINEKYFSTNALTT